MPLFPFFKSPAPSSRSAPVPVRSRSAVKRGTSRHASDTANGTNSGTSGSDFDCPDLVSPSPSPLHPSADGTDNHTNRSSVAKNNKPTTRTLSAGLDGFFDSPSRGRRFDDPLTGFVMPAQMPTGSGTPPRFITFDDASPMKKSCRGKSPPIPTQKSFMSAHSSFQSSNSAAATTPTNDVSHGNGESPTTLGLPKSLTPKKSSASSSSVYKSSKPTKSSSLSHHLRHNKCATTTTPRRPFPSHGTPRCATKPNSSQSSYPTVSSNNAAALDYTDLSNIKSGDLRTHNQTQMRRANQNHLNVPRNGPSTPPSRSRAGTNNTNIPFTSCASFVSAECPSEISVATSSGMWRQVDQSVCIFDWDDTLCPSSWIVANALPYFSHPPAQDMYRKPLQVLAAKVVTLIRQAKQWSTVIIVTAAQVGWVESSAANFLGQEVVNEIKNVKIIYAREVFSRNQEWRRKNGLPRVSMDEGFSVSKTWKVDAMRDVLREHYGKTHSWKNILSIGDSFDEQASTLQVTAEHQNPCSKKTGEQKTIRVKTVKMLECPSMPLLITQVELLTEHIAHLIAHDNAEFPVNITFQKEHFVDCLQEKFHPLPIDCPNAKTFWAAAAKQMNLWESYIRTGTSFVPREVQEEFAQLATVLRMSASDAGIRSLRSRDFSVMNSIEEDDNNYHLGHQPYVPSNGSQLAPSGFSAPNMTYNNNAGSDNNQLTETPGVIRTVDKQAQQDDNWSHAAQENESSPPQSFASFSTKNWSRAAQENESSPPQSFASFSSFRQRSSPGGDDSPLTIFDDSQQGSTPGRRSHEAIATLVNPVKNFPRVVKAAGASAATTSSIDATVQQYFKQSASATTSSIDATVEQYFKQPVQPVMIDAMVQRYFPAPEEGMRDEQAQWETYQSHLRSLQQCADNQSSQAESPRSKYDYKKRPVSRSRPSKS